jgi:hypothetical protein
MITDPHAARAIASSIHITGRAEAESLVALVAPLCPEGRITPAAELAACRFLYAGYDGYSESSKAQLLQEARSILRLTETAAPGENAPRLTQGCGCECCSGGFCGGCGHAGCGKR